MTKIGPAETLFSNNTHFQQLLTRILGCHKFCDFFVNNCESTLEDASKLISDSQNRIAVNFYFCFKRHMVTKVWNHRLHLSGSLNPHFGSDTCVVIFKVSADTFITNVSFEIITISLPSFGFYLLI